MNYEDFIVCFKRQIYSLGIPKQLDLCISVCKILYTDYSVFTENHSWGDPGILLDSIKFCEHAKLEIEDKIKIEKMLRQVDKITPDIDDFGDEISSYALNACCAVYETLQFILDQDPMHVIDVGMSLTDTIDLKIQENKNFTKEQVDGNLLMIEARNYLLENSR